MTSITAYTADKMAAIEAAVVVGGTVTTDHLILTKHDASTIDTGSVRGPTGITGVIGDVNQATADALVPIKAGWTAWTPTLTASVTNPALGSTGVKSGFYARVGNMIFWRARLRAGGSSISAGSGAYYMSPPVPPVVDGSSEGQDMGCGYFLFNASPNGLLVTLTWDIAAGAMRITGENGIAIDQAHGFITAADNMDLVGSYEAA